jgi:hypothetical protein
MSHVRESIAALKELIGVLSDIDGRFQILFIDLFLAAMGAGDVSVNYLVV